MNLALLLAVSLAQEPAERELSTDRPDKTESPYTVPDGRWQVEIDAVAYARDGAGNAISHSWDLGAFNLKRGLGSRADVQLVIVPLRHEVAGRGLGRVTDTGAGEAVGRFKFNLLGNDGGRSALAVMPFVSLTPAVDGRVLEGGLIVPLALDLAPGWGLGAMFEADLVRIEGLGGRRPVLVYSATIGRDLSSSLGSYVEIFTAYTPALGSDRWNASLDFGVTWGIGADVQLDGGINFGLTAPAEDVNPFLGVSLRF